MLFKLVKKLAAQETSGVGLGLFRIAYSAVLLGEIFQLLYFESLIFDEIPTLLPAETDFTFLLWAWAIVVFCLLIGYRTRTAAICNYVVTLGLLSTFTSFSYHLDYALTGLNFLLMFIPEATPFSLDRRALSSDPMRRKAFEKKRLNFPAGYNYLLVFTGVAIVYFDSCWHKLGSPMWTSGLGVWKPASIVYMTWIDLSFVLNQKWLMLFLGYLTLVFEVVFPFLFFIRRCQPALLIIGVGLHLGIIVAFPIPWFGFGVAGLYFLIVPDDWLRKIKAFAPYFVNLDSSDKAVDLSPSGLFWVKITTAYLYVAILLQFVSIVQSPIGKMMLDSLLSRESHLAVSRFSRSVIDVSEPLLGITPHWVFMDGHFDNYHHVVAVTYNNGLKTHWIPIINEKGMPSYYCTGRTFVFNTFRANNPDIDRQKLARGLRDWTAFWANKNGVSLGQANFDILVKKIEAPRRWERGFLHRQMAKPWTKVGEIRWQNGQVSFNLPDIESL